MFELGTFWEIGYLELITVNLIIDNISDKLEHHES